MRRLVSALMAAFLAAGCATTPGARPDAPWQRPDSGGNFNLGGGPETPRADPSIAIPSRLHASAEAWNLGDLDGFLAPYLDSPETTFIGGSGLVHGLDGVRARYESSYWSSGRPANALSFTDINVQPLGPAHALVTGRYILSDRDSGNAAASGYFSLVWRHVEDYGWQIIHDHSSAESSR